MYYICRTNKQITMKKGIQLNYFGKMCKVLDFDKTHVLVQFENGTKLCTDINAFKQNK
jgi:hypothetical protein